MKNILSLSILIFLFITIACSDKSLPELTEQIKNGLRKDAKEFSESLKNILVKEIRTNGIVSAVNVCSDTAQILTNDYGVSKGIYIKRVTFKNRNQNSIPDEYESKALKYFEELKSSGKLDETTEYIEIEETNGIKKIRYLKPIIIQPLCLNCHGSTEDINQNVKNVLNTRYPDDKATEYQTDDLRGAVSISKTL
ncbi:MAG TPA: DUF3365 domain-containing protein [Ignavibacteriaceae bacterium]|jgi:hypothetical protein|nr:MAG: hypothetical protein BWY38_01103 [Ignavibacteria bacterium ADurb.Bin266]OQY72777.1 MAG: hypothetical protein B6D44_09245 [Ignavibacteriales bacterium UTCHB2]HQF41617.1 DUF3365 domain-containing protein [Ignavibacteriaceae bacterium]HQI40655.1 DUF3365 domain-containing protein [Ignavibacteriaceae bacterium]HQJ45191.1 DUF3365 domain-containing protein [Ignavibacteriaceae bacterium]